MNDINTLLGIWKNSQEVQLDVTLNLIKALAAEIDKKDSRINELEQENIALMELRDKTRALLGDGG